MESGRELVATAPPSAPSAWFIDLRQNYISHPETTYKELMPIIFGEKEYSWLEYARLMHVTWLCLLELDEAWESTEWGSAIIKFFQDVEEFISDSDQDIIYPILGEIYREINDQSQSHAVFLCTPTEIHLPVSEEVTNVSGKDKKIANWLRKAGIEDLGRRRCALLGGFTFA